MSLYTRLTQPSSNKIPIHGFKELMHDYYRGNITAQNVIDEFNLDAGETAEATAIYQAAVNATNKLAYFEQVFGYLAMAELGLMPSQYNEANFNAFIAGV